MSKFSKMMFDDEDEEIEEKIDEKVINDAKDKIISDSNFAPGTIHIRPRQHGKTKELKELTERLVALESIMKSINMDCLDNIDVFTNFVMEKSEQSPSKDPNKKGHNAWKFKGTVPFRKSDLRNWFIIINDIMRS